MKKRTANRRIVQIQEAFGVQPVEKVGLARPTFSTTPVDNKAQAALAPEPPAEIPPTKSQRAAARMFKKTRPESAPNGAIPESVPKPQPEPDSRARELPEQLTIPWSTPDPQKALPAVVQGLIDALGTGPTEKLLKAQLARIANRQPEPDTADVDPSTCEHPRSAEKIHGWGVLCGVCKTKVR